MGDDERVRAAAEAAIGETIGVRVDERMPKGGEYDVFRRMSRDANTRQAKKVLTALSAAGLSIVFDAEVARLHAEKERHWVRLKELVEDDQKVRADLDRALDALREGVALWHEEQRHVDGDRVAQFLSAARAVIADHDQEPG